MFQILQNVNVDWLKHRKVFILVSVAIMLGGMASAIDAGFDRAFVTIIDTHVTTIVSSLFLFVFGTGPIRGFAVTLVLGLLANLFTAVYVSRTIFMWEMQRKLSKRGRVETLSI